MDIIDTDISSFETEIDNLNIMIEDLQKKIDEKDSKDDKNDRFDAAQSGNNPFNLVDVNNDKNVDTNPNSMIEMLQTKDIIMIGLILINMVMVIFNCIDKNNKNSKGKYQTRDCELSEDEIQLK